MGQSFWMKSQDGSYSNNKVDTFDPGKKYAGVRLQAGLLPLDRDWNELEDIRRYEEVMLRKWYIGNGTPDDGFKISPVEGSNDFSISPGRCLIDGFEVVNDSQILYSKQKDVPALTAPSGKRSDTVYIDFWIREISGSEDPALMNPQDLGRETCRRHKVEWRIRVDEGRGAGSTGHSPAEEFHHYYDIARIDRDGSQASIIDLRRTGLALYLLKDSSDELKGSLNALKESLASGKMADALHRHSMLARSNGSPVPALSVDGSGNVGIGTESANRRLHVEGGEIHSGGQGTGGFSFSNRDGPNNGEFVENPQSGERWLWCSYGGIARLWSGEYKLSITHEGRVGIGTSDPQSPLGIRGMGTSEGLISFEDLNGNTKWHLTGNLGGTKPGLNFAETGVADGRLFLKPGGNVGIGTMDPAAKLDVAGGINVSGPQAELGFVRRNLSSWPGNKSPGDRFVWYSQDGNSANLWTEGNGDLLGVTSTGYLNIFRGGLVLKKGNGINLNPPESLSPNPADDKKGSFSIRYSNEPPGLHFHQPGDPPEKNRMQIIYYPPFDPNHPIFLGGSEVLSIADNGSIGIGMTKPQRTLHVEGSEIHSGNARGGYAGFSFANRDDPNKGKFVDDGGNPPGQRWVLYAHGRTAALWSGIDRVLVSPDGVVSANRFSSGFVSEAKYKTNIQSLTNTLDKLEKIRGISFEWNDSDPFGRFGKGREIGLIANEVEAVFPELVITWGSENYKGIDYDRLTGVLVEAIKELRAENDASRIRIVRLERELEKARHKSS